MLSANSGIKFVILRLIHCELASTQTALSNALHCNYLLQGFRVQRLDFYDSRIMLWSPLALNYYFPSDAKDKDPFVHALRRSSEYK